MNERTLRVLEYPKIIERLVKYAGSLPGKRLCREMTPSDDPGEIARMQRETTDALGRVYQKGSVSFSGVKDLRDSLRRLEIGSSLNIPELLDVCKLLEACGRVKSYSRKTNEEIPDDSLDQMFRELEPLPSVSGAIRRCILSEDEIADDASPGLRQVRRAMAQTNDKIRSQLNSMVNGSARTYLQEAVITQRNGRYCLPVKAEYRSQVPGMIHDQSSTGSTLFVEPMAVVKLNNDMRELELREEKEIEAVLAELSSRVAESGEAISNDILLLTQLDFIFARAMLSKSYNGFEPDFNQNGIIDIRQGRHPLLDPKKVVPVDIRLGEEFDLLVISGPNTGGKTVSLKTVGLFTLMGQAGLHIPAREHSRLALFHEVFADIGDEQSIEQSLSTFSSHMTNIVSFWEQADGRSLVLFDELGAGTDPIEGAALAIAIIEHVRQRGAKVAATTHYAELKTFAMTTPGVENASCEFDVETLRPTYKLLIGIPGKSNAFAIAQRLGLDPAVIDTAKAQMDSESVRFEDVLTQLEEKRQSLEKDRDEAARLRAQREADAKRAREFREQMERAKDNARTRGEAEARRIIREARAQADAIFEELNQLRRAQEKQADWQNVNQARTAIRSQLNQAEEDLRFRQEAEPIPAPSRPIRVGDQVELGGTRTRATVTAVNGDRLQLAAGNMKLTVKAREVRLIEEVEKEVKSGPTRHVQTNIRTTGGRAASTELDIRGMMTDEAELVVDQFLDHALMSKLNLVTIIHGKGTGALRQAVRQQLKRHPAVKSFRPGRYGEGEDGVTVVELKG